MINVFYRWMFVLLGMAPLSIGLLAAGSDGWLQFVKAVVVGVIFTCLACAFFCFWVNKVAKDQERLTIKLSRVVKRRGGADSYLMAYILPLMVGEQLADFELIGLMCLFAFVSFFSEVESNNPVAKMLGYRFYDVETIGGNNLLIMSKLSMQDILRFKCESGGKMSVVLFDDNFAIQV